MSSKLLVLIAATVLAQEAGAATLVQSADFTRPVAGIACNPCASGDRVFTSFHLARGATADAATFAVRGYDPGQPIMVGVFARLDDAVGPALFDLALTAAVDPAPSRPGTTLLRVTFTGVPLGAGDYYFALGAADALTVPFFMSPDSWIHVIGAGGDTRSDYAVAGFRLDGAAAVVAGIPEPATWLLLLTGYGLIGFALRRRIGWGAPISS